MAKVKTIIAKYNKKDGVSIATVRTKYGDFSGTAKVHNDDKDIASDFVGCSYAETRAIIKYEKAKLKDFKNRLAVINNLNEGLKRLKDYDKNNAEARYVRKQYFITREMVKNQEAKIQFFNDYLDKNIKNYRVEKEKFDKKLKQIQEKRKATQSE